MFTDLKKYKDSQDNNDSIKESKYSNQINEAFKHKGEEDELEKQDVLLKRAGKTVIAIDEPISDEAIAADGGSKYKRNLNTKFIEMKLKAKQPFFIMGHAGWGKTSIIKQVAREMGLAVITIYLDKVMPEDLAGIPIPEKTSDGKRSYVENAFPSWAQYIYEHPDEDFLVFFDEMNQAKDDVQNALMPILLESVICGVKFHNIWFGGAGNYAEENASVIEFSKPLRSRFIKEAIWEEQWEDVFPYLNSKYENKLPAKLLDTIQRNRISLNPRDYEAFLNAILKNKNNTDITIEETKNFVEHFDHTLVYSGGEKTTGNRDSVARISEELFKYFANGGNDVTEAPVSNRKAPKRSPLSKDNLQAARSIAINGGHLQKSVNSWDEFVELTNATPEEVEYIKNHLKQENIVPKWEK